MEAFNIQEPIYKEWCLEFLCSMQIKPTIKDLGVTTDKFLKFRLGGMKYDVTLFELGNLMGLYSQEELRNKDFKAFITSGDRGRNNFDANGFWKRISSEERLEFGVSKVASIKKPLLQVLHRVIVQSILHRTFGVNEVFEEDLWVLQSLEERHPRRHLNVAWVIVEYLHRKSATGQKNYLCGGHFISRIARNLGLFNEKDMKGFSEPVIPLSTDTKWFTHLRESNGKLKGLPEVFDVEPITTWVG